MARTRITKEILISRLKDKFSNEDGTLIELNSWKLVNDFLKEVRKLAVEYKIERFEEDALELYSDNNLEIEYMFRHEGYSPVLYEHPDEDDVIWISRYIDWCYKIGMSEKNQIRLRFESLVPHQYHYDEGLPKTKLLRNFRNYYKYAEEEKEIGLL